MNPSILNSLEIAVLKFTRKIVLQAVDLTEVDFETLRKEGLNNGDIIRIIAIAAMSLGETIVSRAIEAEPKMPEFAKDIKM